MPGKTTEFVDPRFELLDALVRQAQFRQDALIEILHQAQALFEYLSEPVLLRVAHSLRLPPSRVYGVATFYHLFSTVPPREHECFVCMGTACFVRGAAKLWDVARATVGDRGGKIALRTARCLGASGIAPVSIYDGELFGRQTAEEVARRLKEWVPDAAR